MKHAFLSGGAGLIGLAALFTATTAELARAQEVPACPTSPMRLVVPWKYGFKSIKSISAIRFVSEEPETSWKQSAPREYGFYSNVNPNRSHPRWSQASERIIGAGPFARRDTEMFNGYDEVASLYTGMDLNENY